MPRRRARRSMAVSSRVLLVLYSTMRALTKRTDGYGHLILRVEFAKRAT